MSLAADHLLANVVNDCSHYRKLRLNRAGELDREKGMIGDDDDIGSGAGQMLTNEDLSQRYARRTDFCRFGNVFLPLELVHSWSMRLH